MIRMENDETKNSKIIITKHKNHTGSFEKYGS